MSSKVMSVPLRRSTRRATAQVQRTSVETQTVAETTGPARSEESGPVKPRRGRRNTNVTLPLASPTSESDSILLDNDSPSRKGKGKRKQVAQEAGEGADDDQPKRKKRAPKPEPVYIIPEVEKKEIAFRGRLGYACLNTILRNKKPASEAVFCSRTCRIDTIQKNSIEWVKEIGRKNVEDMITIIQWNEDNNIRFMRMSSEMFPFASHPLYQYDLSFCAPLLARVGALANRLGHRLTTHPGQFTQLGSPRAEVLANSVRDLIYHCEMIDRMGLGKDSVMIIHGGGVFGDKAATLERIKKNIQELPKNVRDRLVLENDEICYNAEDLLPLCEELDIPLVFDYHHDQLYPSSIPPTDIISRANVIFARRGIRAKQHLSEPRPGAVTVMERRAHSDRCTALPPDLPEDMDLMIEAKDKEQAVLHLYRIYGLQPVKHESLRPPNEHQTKETNGRKSPRKAKKLREAAALAVNKGKVNETEDGLSDDDDHGIDDQDKDLEGDIVRENVLVDVEIDIEAEGAVPKSSRRTRKTLRTRGT